MRKKEKTFEALTGMLLILAFAGSLFFFEGKARASEENSLTGAGVKQKGPEFKLDVKSDIGERFGIEILSVRQSAAGHMLDFRYRVIDPDKALALLDRKNKPHLIDQATGAKLIVPNPPKIGPLRQTSTKPLADKNYFILFENPQKLVKPGARVTVAIGDFEAKDLVVE